MPVSVEALGTGDGERCYDKYPAFTVLLITFLGALQHFTGTGVRINAGPRGPKQSQVALSITGEKVSMTLKLLV